MVRGLSSETALVGSGGFVLRDFWGTGCAVSGLGLGSGTNDQRSQSLLDGFPCQRTESKR